MKFDGILHFLGDINKEELFTNIKYWKVVNGEISLEEAPKEFKFINNFQKLLSETHVTQQLLKTFNGDYEVLEVRIGRLLSLNKKK